MTVDQLQNANLTIQHVKFLTTLSQTQVYAMERAGMFPRRQPVSNTRGVWCHRAICDWMQRCVDARTGTSIVHVRPDDRFITKRELIRLVGITEPTFALLERTGRFPARIRISRGRVAWLHREVIHWLYARPQLMTLHSRVEARIG